MADLVIGRFTRSAVRQITRSRSRTMPRPLTDNRVSINDQVLMVCPTVIPKYSLTSQNPASLTWEKNSEPAPTASTTSETWLVPMPSTRPIISEEAVMVATVAEPVARRISTARIQASTMTGKWAPSAHRASSVPIPLSTRTCLKPPPAATIRMIPATGRGPDSMATVRCLRVMPAPRPRVIMDDHRDQQRQQRGTQDVENPPDPLGVIVDEDLDQGLAEHQHHRQQHGEQGDAEGGTAPLGADLGATALLAHLRATALGAHLRATVTALVGKRVRVEGVGRLDHDPFPGQLPEQR